MEMDRSLSENFIPLSAKSNQGWEKGVFCLAHGFIDLRGMGGGGRGSAVAFYSVQDCKIANVIG